MAAHPVLIGYPDGDGGVLVWCPFCNEWHRHSRGNGMRVSHCGRGSSVESYEVREITPDELKQITNGFRKEALEYRQSPDSEVRGWCNSVLRWV
jgi:hypothetical protein